MKMGHSGQTPDALRFDPLRGSITAKVGYACSYIVSSLDTRSTLIYVCAMQFSRLVFIALFCACSAGIDVAPDAISGTDASLDAPPDDAPSHPNAPSPTCTTVVDLSDCAGSGWDVVSGVAATSSPNSAFWCPATTPEPVRVSATFGGSPLFSAVYVQIDGDDPIVRLVPVGIGTAEEFVVPPTAGVGLFVRLQTEPWFSGVVHVSDVVVEHSCSDG